MKAMVLAALLALTSVAEAVPRDPPQSIYNLRANLVDQTGAGRGLDMHRGHPVLVTMFYGSCAVACPLLIDTLRSFERSLTPAERAEIRVVLISIDPEHDTSEKLRTLATDRRIDLSRWTLVHTDEATVRKIAAVLNIQYRRLPDGTYNHASIITLLTPQGEIAARSSVLGKADERLVAALRGL
ncbi:MAG TPA: SCO family protein [Steroidobacteraceae bacterium]|jgi:protein SCO1|nr:SCO family protein [Steroidobacteraceae bacterium]